MGCGVAAQLSLAFTRSPARRTIAVTEDVDEVAAAVTANGGRILMEKATIPGVGDLIWFEDPEGNVAGAMRYESRSE